MPPRLLQALIAYTALAVAAWFMLTGRPRLIVLVVLAAFTAKTLLWHFKPQDPPD